MKNTKNTFAHYSNNKSIRVVHLKARFTLFSFVLLILLSLIIFPFVAGLAAPDPQGNIQGIEQTATPNGAGNSASPDVIASATLERMTPEERVGQLFLVTFEGNQVDPDSQIYDLITNYYVGGVVLLRENDNFIIPDDTPGSTVKAVRSLIRELQSNRWESAHEKRENPITGEQFTPTYVPLFIGISQEGDSYPFDQIFHDITPLPNEMTLGATWNTEITKQVGATLGNELSAIGINLLFGPSLDVLEVSQLDGANNLGTRTFGGDPYWVGEMGKAYIEGVHTGSEGKIAVIAKHFPGHGGSDRLPEEEVATVRKTLEQLKSFELAPFFTVTGNAPTPETTTDGLLTSHIRYQGFQGNIRATTRPISFDPQALNLLMELPELDAWRQSGGVMVSDDLGSLAIRRFYELTSQPFDMPRRVALNAFLAGNDILYIANFASDAIGSYTAATQTFEFFAQKYREDPAFAQRVDESVLRILKLKYKLYNEFSLNKVIPTNINLDQVGSADDISFQAARESATLISPSRIDLDEILPDAPNLNDRIVIISDSRTAYQCSECPEEPILDYRLLEKLILNRYGPQAGSQVTLNNIISYPLSDLEALLNNENGDFPIERSLQRANWVVFALLDNSEEHASYDTLRQFLDRRPDLFQQKRLIVFALNAPYFLDATNISKLTAYYGLYSKIEQSVDVAAYLLFKEQLAEGASPVSIPGISYDINEVLFPNPDQVIPLELDLPVPETGLGTATPQPIPTPEYSVGDVIPIRTGVIYDHNGNPVPDGTQVEFKFTIAGEPNPLIQVANTEDGIAHTTFTVNNSGLSEISAESPPAKSEVLRFDIPPIHDAGENATQVPTEELVALLTKQPTTNATITPTIAGIENIKDDTAPSIPSGFNKFLNWIVAVAISVGVAWISYRLAVAQGYAYLGVRAALLVIIGGLLAYIYLVLGLPGTAELSNRSNLLGVILITFLGVGIGLICAWLWNLIITLRARQADLPPKS
jgi:beta-N-acetylhexosaminidase